MVLILSQPFFTTQNAPVSFKVDWGTVSSESNKDTKAAMKLKMALAG